MLEQLESEALERGLLLRLQVGRPLRLWSLRVVVSDAGNSAIRLLQFPVTSPPATRAAGAALAGEGTVGDFLGAPVAGGEARLPTAAAGGLEVDWEAGTVATVVASCCNLTSAKI